MPQVTEHDEILFRTVIDNLPELAWTALPEGHIDFYNRRWYEYTGTTFEEMEGWGWEKVHAPDMLPKVVERWKHSLETGTPFEMDFPLRGADGVFRWFRTRVRPLRAPGGDVIRWFGTNTDIDDHKRVLEERTRMLEIALENAELSTRVRHSEERYRSLVDATSQIVWTNSAEGQMVGEQPAWAAYTGQTYDQYQGYGWADAVHPDDQSNAIRLWQNAVATRTTYLCEHRVRRSDGAYRLFDVRAVPVLEASGAIREWVGVHTDITERRQNEQVRAKLEAERESLLARETAARREVEAQKTILDLVIEQSGDGIIMADENGVLRIFNPAAAKQHGTEKGAIQASEWASYYNLMTLDGKPLPLEETPLFKAVQGSPSTDARWLVLRRDGQKRTLVGTATPLYRHDGARAGGVLMTRDETDRQHHEDERERLMVALAKSNAELDQFAYVASHDLKAPLRGIANLSQWVEEDLGDALSGESRENMTLMRGRVHRMEALIDGILDYSRAGRVRGKIERVDIGALLAEAVELLSPPPSTKVVIAPGMPTLEVERVPFQQVFLNLIGNAIKYTRRADARVEVSASKEGAFYHFTVTDNGPGIDPKYHERIWGIFQTLEARDTIEGTGIGLSVVKKVVETRGGRTWVESREGAGATFHVVWPAEPNKQAYENG